MSKSKKHSGKKAARNAAASSSALIELEAHLGYRLRHVSNHVSGEFARALQLRQVSIAESVALTWIYNRQGITPGELALRLGMTQGAVSKVLDKLESKGWIERQATPDDQRVQHLTLTAEGSRELPEIASIADGNDKRFFGCLSSGEKARLKDLLSKLAQVHHLSGLPTE